MSVFSLLLVVTIFSFFHVHHYNTFLVLPPNININMDTTGMRTRDPLISAMGDTELLHASSVSKAVKPALHIPGIY